MTSCGGVGLRVVMSVWVVWGLRFVVCVFFLCVLLVYQRLGVLASF